MTTTAERHKEIQGRIALRLHVAFDPYKPPEVRVDQLLHVASDIAVLMVSIASDGVLP